MSDELLKRMISVRVAHHQGQRAPHKPLLMLLALGRVVRGEPRLAPYTDIEGPLSALLRNFGSPRAPRPNYPFNRLRNDKLWEIPNLDRLPQNAAGDLPIAVLREHAEGGFPAKIYERLKSDPALVRRAAQALLKRNFPESLHEDILNAVGISSDDEELRSLLPKRDPAARRRDPEFRRDVLRAYGYRCAVCGYSTLMDNDLFGLEAAHIKWHSEDGPSEVQNGLALCSLHHKALDRGALGLRPASEGSFNIIVSKSVHGSGPDQILSHHDKPVGRPRGDGEDPLAEYVAWHKQQVFRDPAID